MDFATLIVAMFIAFGVLIVAFFIQMMIAGSKPTATSIHDYKYHDSSSKKDEEKRKNKAK